MMESVVFCRSPQRSEVVPEEPYPGSTTAPGFLASHLAPASSGNGTSAELGWELIDIFESGMFAFPIYDHDSARDIVRYLLERGILEEEIADAIKDSTVDMNIWLEKGDKYMVGEWVIAWINACREDYVKHKGALVGVGGMVGYRGRKRVTSLDGSMDSLGRQYGRMDDDDDDDDGDHDGDCADWGGLREDKSEEDVANAEEERCSYSRGELCSNGSSRVRGIASYGSGQSFGQEMMEGSNDDLNSSNAWCSSSPSSPPTPFHRLAPFLRPFDQPGAASAGTRRKTLCWRTITSPSLHHLVQTDEKTDSGIVSDFFETVSHDDVHMEQEHSRDCRSLQKSSLCSAGSVASSAARCSCKVPHYAVFPTPPPSDTHRCTNCGKEKTTIRHQPSSAASTTSGQGQYYKDFIIRALEYTLETIDREGPGYLFILTDSQDRALTWTQERRFRVASSVRPEVCIAAYRSRNIMVDLLWQIRMVHHSHLAAEVQATLEKYRLHSNWFRCSLAVVMETVYDVMSRYHAVKQTTIGCQTTES